MKSVEHFRVMRFLLLCKVVFGSVSIDEMIKSKHSNESYRTVLFCHTNLVFNILPK